MEQIAKVDFIGLGAIGTQFARFIEKRIGEGNVTFWANKERTARYRKEGIFCNGEKCGFYFRAPDQASEPSQLLILAVKATALDDAIELARPLVGRETIVITLLNGISSEEILEDRLKTGHVIRCVPQKMDALKSGNRVTYRDIGELCIGNLPGDDANTEALAKLDGFFTRIGLPHAVDANIVHRLWCKWMLNVGVNQTVMVFEGNFRDIQKDGEARQTVIKAMKEVQALSQAARVNITDSDFDSYMYIIDHLNPDGMPSMRQDGFNRRKSEVELFAGTVIRKGKELGVPTPCNQWLYDRVKEIESSY